MDAAEQNIPGPIPHLAPIAEASPSLNTDAHTHHARGVFSTFSAGCTKRDVAKRDITVWIPPGTAYEGRRELDVLLVLDGQHAFAKDNSLPNLALERRILELSASGRIAPIAVVAVENLGLGDRIYNFCADKLDHYPANMKKGNLPNFCSWLRDDVRSKVAQLYGLSEKFEKWSIAGASLASAPALALALSPDPIKNAFSLSPGLWRKNETKDGQVVQKVLSVFDSVKVPEHFDTKIFLGVGGLEAPDRGPNHVGLFTLTDRFLSQLQHKAPDATKRAVVAKVFNPNWHDSNEVLRHSGDHNEGTWGAMMHDFLVRAFGRA